MTTDSIICEPESVYLCGKEFGSYLESFGLDKMFYDRMPIVGGE